MKTTTLILSMVTIACLITLGSAVNQGDKCRYYGDCVDSTGKVGSCVGSGKVVSFPFSSEISELIQFIILNFVFLLTVVYYLLSIFELQNGQVPNQWGACNFDNPLKCTSDNNCPEHNGDTMGCDPVSKPF